MTDKNKELDLNSLEKVSGGGINEQIAEIKAAILANPYLLDMWDSCYNNPIHERDEWWICADVVNRVCHINVEKGKDENIYNYGDHTHDWVMQRIRNYRPSL